MGFYLNLLILKPQERDFGLFDPTPKKGKKKVERKCTLWEIETILNLQRISAPVNDAGFKDKTAKERAALHFFNSFFGKLMEQVNQTGKECLAPPFAILKAKKSDTCDTLHDWQSQFVTVPGEKNWFVNPLSGWSIHSQFPSQRTMEEHNESLKKSQGHAKTSDIILAKPLVWAPCKDVTEWIAEGERVKTFVTLKEDDLDAAAYFAMWKASIKEMGKVGANALFLFENLHHPSVA